MTQGIAVNGQCKVSDCVVGVFIVFRFYGYIEHLSHKKVNAIL